jgi:hypothetical protein
MSRPVRPARVPPIEVLHARFLLTLPRVELHGRIYSRHLRSHKKADAIQEMRAGVIIMLTAALLAALAVVLVALALLASTQPRPRKGPVWQAPPTERVTCIFVRRGLPQLAEVRPRAEALKSRTLPWITPAALIIWIALSQVSVLSHAWSCWSH